MASDTIARCGRCYSEFTLPGGYRMAGRLFCCSSCSVGSACEHQGIHRASSVRRYDSMFDRFRAVAKESTPYETNSGDYDQ